MRQASGQHQNQKNIVAKLTETKAKTHHHPKISLQQCWQSKVCSAALLPMALLVVFEHFVQPASLLTEWQQLSQCHCGTVPWHCCHPLLVLKAQLLLPSLACVGLCHSCCFRWLIMQFFNFIRIILLPANAGIAATCAAQLLLPLVDCSVF